MCGPAVSTRLFPEGARSHILHLPLEMQNAIWQGEDHGSYDDPSYQQALAFYYHRQNCMLDPWPECVNDTFSGMGDAVYRRMWGPSEFTCNGVLKDFDNIHVLQQLNMPVLYTCGEHDEATPASVEQYRKAPPDAKVLILPGASHMHHLERPEAFFDAVRAHLDRTDG